MKIDQTIAMLNEAVSLDPNLWALFDVNVPCASIVGHATPIELMAVNPTIAMANCLGMLNGILADKDYRISIITENEGGRARRVFIRTSNAPVSDSYSDAGVSAVPSDIPLD
jgi:hypothetical protein